MLWLDYITNKNSLTFSYIKRVLANKTYATTRPKLFPIIWEKSQAEVSIFEP